jgi:hypothetical protein
MRTLTLVLLLGTLCAAQESHSDWTSLGNLPQDAKVRIIRPGGTDVTGLFRGWTPDAVTLAKGKDKSLSLERKDVRRAYRIEKGSRVRSALWGAVAGFVPGFVLGAAGAGYIADQNNPSTGTRMEAGLAVGGFGAGIGAGLGALAGGTRSTLIYKNE